MTTKIEIDYNEINIDEEKYYEQKKEAEEVIIDSLNDLDKMHIRFVEKEDAYYELLNQKKTYKIETIKNITKAFVASSAAALIAQKIIDGDYYAVEQIALTLTGGLIGTSLFQIDTARYDSYNKYELADATYDYLEQTEQLELNISILLANILKYIPYIEKREPWEELVTRMFKSNENYINTQKNKGLFAKDFGVEKVNEIIKFYLGDTKALDSTITKLYTFRDENSTIKEEAEQKEKVRRIE